LIVAPSDIRAAVVASPALMQLVPEWQGIADALSVSVVQSIPVETLFDVLFATGDYMALKQAQFEGVQSAVLAFATLADAKALGSGMVNQSLPATIALLDALQSDGLLSGAGRDALTAAATVVQRVTAHEVEVALKNPDGSMAI
jgi:hypothetical protein